jgi:hypothetical protein
MAVDRIVMRPGLCRRTRLVVGDDLMAEQVEIDPFVGASPFRTWSSSPPGKARARS